MNTIPNTQQVIAFTKVQLPFGWRGNMAPYPVRWEGEVWPTTEALFQAMRFADAPTRDAIRACKSPMAAKMKAKGAWRNLATSAICVEPRSPADVDNMRICLRLKLAQHPDLAEQLLATGNQTIVEDATRRRGASAVFWGAQLRDDGCWHGANTLGRLWMELREELRATGQ